jgi:hypothetical protein
MAKWSRARRGSGRSRYWRWVVEALPPEPAPEPQPEPAPVEQAAEKTEPVDLSPD